eukprot:1182665-Prorocentrum_minimum.AAC.1
METSKAFPSKSKSNDELFDDFILILDRGVDAPELRLLFCDAKVIHIFCLSPQRSLLARFTAGTCKR